MIYSDKPDWSACSDEQVKQIADIISEQSERLTKDCSFNFEIDDDCGQVYVSGRVTHGYIDDDLYIALMWADRDGDFNADAAIDDNRIMCKDLENIILGRQ